MITVGVTGGIASGKSTVCERLSGLGARMFNADAEARELMLHDPGVRAGVVQALGEKAYKPDGTLDKSFISDRIFSSEPYRRALEAVVHPAVAQRFRAARQAAEAAGCPMLVKEQAVFPGEEARAGVDHWVVVEAPQEARLDRAARRAGQSPDQARARMQAQPDAATYRSIADTVIENDGTLEELNARVDRLWEELTGNPFPIPIGARVPRRKAHRWVRRLLYATGWQFEGEVPDERKFVLIGAPHTSNWDFVLAMCVVFGLGLDFHWIGKHTLFRGPLGPLMRWTGGIPVNRERPGRLVHDTIRAFQEREQFVVGISPEGTRRDVDTWKSGFHRIAVGAKAPILPAYIDAERKRIGFGTIFRPTDDRAADMAHLMFWYKQFS